MSKRISHVYWIVGVVVTIIMLIGLSSANKPAYAEIQKPQPASLDNQLLVSKQASALTVRDDARIGLVQTAFDGQPASVAEPQTENDILQLVNEYNEQATADIMQPGWTYVQFEQYDFIQLYSPKPLPVKYQKEFWSHFDAEGKVFEQIDYVTAPEIGKVPLGVFSNGTLVSLWNDGLQVAKNPYTPSYDLYLASSIKGLMDGGIPHKLSFEKSSLEDKAVSLIELQTQFMEVDKQWFNVKLDKPALGQLEKFYFEPQTGKLVRYEHNYVLEDGTLVPSAIMDHFQYAPKSTPPSDVMTLLAKGGK